jgi:CRP-like cAMP-binding protein
MAAVPQPSRLSPILLLQGLIPVELARLTRRVHYHTVPAGTTIITLEQPGEVVYFLLSGMVKSQVEQADGREDDLALLGPGAPLGELGLLEPSGPASPGGSASVQALDPCTLAWIDRGAFAACLETMPRLTLNLAQTLAHRLRLANAQIQALATQDVVGRVAHQVLAFAAAYGRETED